MNSLMLKKIAPVVFTLAFTLPSYSQGITNGSIPCQDVASNGEAYGCHKDSDENVQNAKYKCLKALEGFQVPLGNVPNEFSSHGKVQKGDKLVAMGTSDGSLALGDSVDNYKVPKEKIKQALEGKFGQEAKSKEDFKVVFQTPKGKIKLKIKKKKLGDQNWDLGKWEKLKEETDSQDSAIIALGTADKNPEAMENSAQALDSKVQHFDSQVERKLQEIEEKYGNMIGDIRRQEGLTTADKLAMVENMRDEKEKKKNIWRRKKEQKENLKRNARRKCRGQAGLISESSLNSTSNPMGGGSRGIASHNK